MKKANSELQDVDSYFERLLPNNFGSCKLTPIEGTDSFVIKTTINPNAARDHVRRIAQDRRRHGLRTKISAAFIRQLQRALDAKGGFTIYVPRPSGPRPS